MKITGGCYSSHVVGVDKKVAREMQEGSADYIGTQQSSIGKRYKRRHVLFVALILTSSLPTALTPSAACRYTIQALRLFMQMCRIQLIGCLAAYRCTCPALGGLFL
jgi:hypothetical protein